MVRVKIASVVILMSWLRSWLFLSKTCRGSNGKRMCGLGLRMRACSGHANSIEDYDKSRVIKTKSI
jgi:hypothetical protein